MNRRDSKSEVCRPHRSGDEHFVVIAAAAHPALIRAAPRGFRALHFIRWEPASAVGHWFVVCIIARRLVHEEGDRLEGEVGDEPETQ